MEEERCSFTYQSAEPYPPTRTDGRNQRYGVAMLDNMGGCNSEMSAVSLYCYNRLVTAGMPELAECFHHISMVEMRHLEIFGTLALQLGMDPRLWTARQGRRTWWTPEYNHYPRKLGPLLQNALREERATIQKYENQLRWIRDSGVAENLRRIIVDEKLHVDILRTLLESYAGNGLMSTAAMERIRSASDSGTAPARR